MPKRGASAQQVQAQVAPLEHRDRARRQAAAVFARPGKRDVRRRLSAARYWPPRIKLARAACARRATWPDRGRRAARGRRPTRRRSGCWNSRRPEAGPHPAVRPPGPYERRPRLPAVDAIARSPPRAGPSPRPPSWPWPGRLVAGRRAPAPAATAEPPGRPAARTPRRLWPGRRFRSPSATCSNSPGPPAARTAPVRATPRHWPRRRKPFRSRTASDPVRLVGLCTVADGRARCCRCMERRRSRAQARRSRAIVCCPYEVECVRPQGPDGTERRWRARRGTRSASGRTSRPGRGLGSTSRDAPSATAISLTAARHLGDQIPFASSRPFSSKARRFVRGVSG